MMAHSRPRSAKLRRHDTTGNRPCLRVMRNKRSRVTPEPLAPRHPCALGFPASQRQRTACLDSWSTRARRPWSFSHRADVGSPFRQGGSPMRTQPRPSPHATAALPAEPPMLDVIVEQAAGLRLVIARGDLDAATVAHLDDALDITPAQSVDLLVDLSRVEFIDCAGGHRLERAASAQAAAGRHFAIACTGGSEVARFFETLAASCLELPVHHSRA